MTTKHKFFGSLAVVTSCAALILLLTMSRAAPSTAANAQSFATPAVTAITSAALAFAPPVYIDPIHAALIATKGTK